jgi:hypothetical protein
MSASKSLTLPLPGRRSRLIITEFIKRMTRPFGCLAPRVPAAESKVNANTPFHGLATVVTTRPAFRRA